MRLAHLSDLHVTSGPRLADHEATLRAVVDAAVAERPDLWLLTGDLWGRTVPHSSTPGERAVLYPALVRMADAAPVVVVVGNHDSAADLAALAHLGGRFPILVIDRGGRHRVETRAGVVNLYGLPHPTPAWLLDGETSGAEARAAAEERLRQLLAAWAHMIRTRRRSHPDEVHILAAHGEVEGVGIGDGEVVATGEVRLPRAALDELPVDYGALGHIHRQQEAARRCWYSGSLWHTEHGDDLPERGWLLVGIGHADLSAGDLMYTRPFRALDDDGRLPATVVSMPSPCRPFGTLRWAWGPTGWEECPEVLEVAGAEVRCILTVPEALSSACPWAAELARVRAAGAERVVVERRTLPSVRVRAPAVAVAETPEAKLRAWWGTLETPPAPEVQTAALGALADVE